MAQGFIRSSVKRAGARFGLIATALGVAMIAPTAAYAEGGLVVPRPSAPITPRVASAPTPMPTLPDQSPSQAPSPAPSQSGDPDARYPYPEGIAKSTDPECEAEVFCEQQWYAYYVDRANNLMGEFDPNFPTYGVVQDYRFFEEKAKEAKAVIEAHGGDPEALTGNGDDSADGGDSSSNTSNASDTSSQARAAAPTPLAVASDIAYDAITGATPILKPDPKQGWAIGEYELDLPDWLMAVLNGIGNGGMSDQAQHFDQPEVQGSQYGGATFGGQTDSNGNVCSKATKSNGGVVTCVD